MKAQEQEEEQEQARGQSDFLRSLMDAALDAVIVMDARGLVVHWNQQAESIFGWSRDDVLGQPLVSLIIPPRYRDAHAEGLRRFLATGEGPILNQRVELSALRRDASELPVELTVTTVELGQEPAFAGFVRDISQQKRAQARLERQLFEVQLLYQATVLAAESASFDEALQRCLEIVCCMLGWPVGHAYVPTASQDELKPTAIWYLAEDGPYAALKAVTKEFRFRPGVGLPGRVWQSGAPEWIENAAAHEGFPRGKLLPEPVVQTAFAFPIKARAETLAILEFFTGDSVPQDPALLLMARSVGEQIGRLVERKRAEERQRLLLQELSHRVKNTLAVVQSIAERTGDRAATVPGFLEMFRGRLRALADAHSLLTESDWQGVSLAGLARAALTPYGGHVLLELEELTLRPAVALTLALVFHELATNASKYGALSVGSGQLTLSACTRATESGPELQLVWKEVGGPPVTEPTMRGFGTSLIASAIQYQHEGRTELEWREAGLLCRLYLPLGA